MLSSDSSHLFLWSILMPAPMSKGASKNLEAFFIVVQKPSLSEQVKSNILNIFNNFIEFLLYFVLIL